MEVSSPKFPHDPSNRMQAKIASLKEEIVNKIIFMGSKGPKKEFPHSIINFIARYGKNRDKDKNKDFPLNGPGIVLFVKFGHNFVFAVILG